MTDIMYSIDYTQRCTPHAQQVKAGLVMIEIYLLEALRAFSDTRTLSAASERLHLAEPSVSRAMKKLEEVLGVSLFDWGKIR